MNLRVWMARPEALRVFSRVLVVTVSVSAVATGYFLIKWGLATMSERQARDEAKVSATTITSTRADLQKALLLENAPQYNGMQPAVQFQSIVEKAASERHCELAEFTAASEVAPYLSRFKKKSESSDWLQIEVRMSLKGQPEDVIATLRAIAGSSCLVEFNGVDLTRDEGKLREGAVQAKVELRVLTKKVEA